MPESKSLWKAFGGHKGQQGLGPIAVELCCLFDLVSRAPLHFLYGKSATSEHKLIKKLIESLSKNDLLLLDFGFYSCATFVRILARNAHFIIPATKNMCPRVLRTLGPGDYHCRITNSLNGHNLEVRVVFVCRNGFRRRRLVTSLLDASLYPASELAQLHHMRWDIETFYRDFKRTLRATSWHCLTPITFHKEILMHMIALCLIRTAMLAAGRMKNAAMSSFSFTRAITETRLFLSLIGSGAALLPWPWVWNQFVCACARHRVKLKPGRQFSRDRQEYRRKSRGLENKRAGRKLRPRPVQSQQPKRETLKDGKGQVFLLS